MCTAQSVKLKLKPLSQMLVRQSHLFLTVCLPCPIAVFPPTFSGTDCSRIGLESSVITVDSSFICDVAKVLSVLLHA